MLSRCPRPRRRVLAIALLVSLVACGPTPPPASSRAPGTADRPRPVPLVARDYTYVPATLDVAPGETVLLQVINGGLAIHEAVIGPGRVQEAWEAAEAPTASTPPGPTAVVSVDPSLAGLRVVVGSGIRRDVLWTVPLSAPADPGGWFVGCHIPGHWALGMVIPVRFVTADGSPLPTPR